MDAAIWKKKWLVIPTAAFAVVALFFIYLGTAFSGSRCEGASVRHGEVPKEEADCYACHKKVTPKVAQDWYESKHGVDLVKCYMCHGQPDGKGALPFTAKPKVDVVCQRCHAPAIDRMRQKFGLRAECESCHSFHMNSLHHEAYGRTESKKTLD